MSKTEHTSTPWHVMYPKAFDYRIVESIGDRVICSIDGTYADFDLCEENEDRHHADAKMIVAAVNHHAELVTRLENLVKDLSDDDMDCMLIDSSAPFRTAVKEARETIKKLKS